MFTIRNDSPTPKTDPADGEKNTDTWFLPAPRTDADEVDRQVNLAIQNPVIDGLMGLAGGLLAVLNEDRQILRVNTSFLEFLGVDNPESVLGMRPGESLDCIHAGKGPGGCGTSEYCSTCGTALAIMACMEKNKPVEQKCALTSERNGERSELLFKVRSVPVEIDGKRFLLFFLNEVTSEQQWHMIERVFFHDISNILTAIMGRSEMMPYENAGGKDRLSQEIHSLAQRLVKEVAIQKALLQSGVHSYQPSFAPVPLEKLTNDLETICREHPDAEGKILQLPIPSPDIALITDYSLLLRILINMVNNALEASDEGDTIRLSVSVIEEGLRNQRRARFSVHNPGMIPEDIQRRVFQRNFSTKQGMGRGLGTYSMRLFGEKVLGGSVGFTSTEEAGTEFFLLLNLTEK